MNAIQWGMVIPHGKPRRYYTGIRGLGQDSTDGVDLMSGEGDTSSAPIYVGGPVVDTSTSLPSIFNAPGATPSWGSSGGASSGGGTPVATGTGFNWGSFFNNVFSAANKGFQTYTTGQLQQQALQQRGALSAAQLAQQASLTSSLTGMLPLLLLGGGVVLLVSMMKK